MDNIVKDITQNGDDHWKMRRLLLFGTSLFYMLLVSYVVWRQVDSELARTACSSAMLALMGNVGCYVFGASYEDLSMAKKGFSRINSAYVPTEVTPTPDAPEPERPPL